MVELIEKHLVGYPIRVVYIGGKAEGVLQSIGSRFLLVNTKKGSLFIRMGAISCMEPVGERVKRKKKK